MYFFFFLPGSEVRTRLGVSKWYTRLCIGHTPAVGCCYHVFTATADVTALLFDGTRGYAQTFLALDKTRCPGQAFTVRCHALASSV